MFLNNLKLAFRSILRKKGYSLTSIIGMAVGITCCLVITLFVLDELSYDQYHEKKDRIYRLVTTSGHSGNSHAKIAGRWGLAAKEGIPEVEDITRIVPAGQMLFKKDDKLFYETLGRYADSTTFNVFSYPLIEGNSKTALTAPNSVVLTKSLNQKCFGNESGIGQSITINNEEFLVTGIMEDVPLNSHFMFTYLLSMSSYKHPDKDDWLRWNQYYTYLLVRNESSIEEIPSKMSAILLKNLGADYSNNYTPFLQPLTSIHLHSHLFREMNPNSDVTYIYVFSSIAILILFISAANFINLTTAQASTRAKEIGVRKVSGAYRKQLIYQFLTEASVIGLISLIFSQLLTYATLPLVNNLTGKHLKVDYIHQPAALFIIVGVALFISILAGSYPAFYLSSLKPSLVIKGKWSPGGKNILRKSLVTFQFALSSLLVIAAIIIQQQIHFIETRSLGFDPEQILTVPIQTDYLKTNHETVRRELESIPGVLSVSISGNQPGGSDWGIPSLAEGFTDENMPTLRVMAIDAGFLETFGMEILSGRSFDDERATDSAAYLINEEAARQLGWTDPINKTISMTAVDRKAGPVIGVVKDFHFRSMHEKIGPMVFYMPPVNWYTQYSIKIDASGTQQIIKSIEQKWILLDPDRPFAFSFFDEGYDQLYQQESRLGQIVNYFTLIGVFLACLGLYSLASLTTEQRTKEIGIRKVVGASARQIVVMLSRQYLLLVMLGFMLALPFSIYLLNKWLQTFAYRENINVMLIALGCMTSISVAIVTVVYKSLLAARANPVKSLRTE
jgi:putative ABC transport system permease protein